jgi:hypothetical protein
LAEVEKPKQKKQKIGNDPYLEYLDLLNFKQSPNKPKIPKFLPRDDEDPIVEKKLAFSPGEVKVEKMEKKIVIEDKGQEQKLEDMETCIKDEIGEQIGEYFKMFMEKTE